ncbi:MAG: carboxypeptidase-like regulatory domain-containing protein [Terracidiphilus sp.]|jgi:hypothetical protein
MRNWLRICGLLAVLLLPVGLQCQIGCFPPGGCSCEDEKVSPNLTITNRVKLTGSLLDAFGEPLRYNESIIHIEVRDPLTNEVLSSAAIDERGRFDLGAVPAGKYRLVAFRLLGKKPSRLPLLDQPKPVSCSSKNQCKLEIVLTMHETDVPYLFCPPK